MKRLIPSKQIFTLLFFLIAIVPVSMSFCPFTFTFFGSGTAPAPGGSATLQTCSFIGEATTATGVVAGNQYTVDVTYTSAFPPGITPFVVIYDATFTPIFFGTSPIAFTAPSSGTYYTIPFADAFCTSFDPNFGCNSTLWSNVTSTLPVTLSNFYGEPSAEHNTIRWETSSEVNNDYFNILRSYDGMTFETIGKADGVGFSQGTNRYQFNDVDLRPGTIYYQLEQVDFNGDSEKSNIISLEGAMNRARLIVVNPNPTSGSITIEVREAKGRNATISITDVNGALIKQKVVNTIGVEKCQFDLSKSEQGMYFIRYQDGIKDQTIKLVKR